MTDENVFVRATREHFTYVAAPRADEINTEQLWQLPLTATNERAVTLDSVGRAIKRTLREMGEDDSMLGAMPNKARGLLEAKLEVVKQIIAYRQAEATKRENAVAVATKRKRLMDALASKDEAALANASVDEIRRQLAELDAA